MTKDVAQYSQIDRRQFVEVCVGSLALAAVGCGRGKNRGDFRSSTLIIAYHGGADVLKPDMTNAERLVFLPLMVWNSRGELEGRLAHRWEHSADYREWTYHLRTDVRWHDGVPVTAHDVAFSLSLFSHPDVLILPADAVESVAVHDDSTLTVRSRRGSRLYNVSVVYYPKHRLQHLDRSTLTQWDFWTNPVGNGPYRLVRYVPETMMEFEVNPDYYRRKPKIERVVLKFAGDNPPLTELLSGSVDVIPEANAAQLPKLAKDPRFRVYQNLTDAASWALFWNADNPLFRDVRVRRALTLAIDRDDLRQVVNFGPEIPIVDGPFPPQRLRRGDVPEPLPYDPEQARSLLNEAGWLDRDGDGMREREGRVFRFTALAIGMSPVREMAIYVQDRLRRIGVDMSIQRMENATVRALVKSGRFEAAFSFLEHGAAWLRQHFGPPFPIGYRNSELVGLLDQVSATAAPDVEDRAFRRIAEIFRTDVPATFLFLGNRTIVAHKRLRGLIRPWGADPLVHMEELWLEDESQQ
ncbi:MAG TPA: ABC transporter substrate-binding protein [Gemmatimonadaceae bacterium]|nr:ABC transporter substrate-binding protein [Gemmatimonadaceae bacterium]